MGRVGDQGEVVEEAEEEAVRGCNPTVHRGRRATSTMMIPKPVLQPAHPNRLQPSTGPVAPEKLEMQNQDIPSCEGQRP